MAACRTKFLLKNCNILLKRIYLIKNPQLPKASCYHFNEMLCVQNSGIHTSSCHRDLMEFFDKEENWKKREVKCGRSWKIDELRIKSNSDLHKLWFVLLKEHNMLLTMEYICKKEAVVFPNPERIDKVRDSMKSLEDVVRERNRAYYLLETGETGERVPVTRENLLGIEEEYYPKEQVIPEDQNPEAEFHLLEDVEERAKFKRLLMEKNKKRESWQSCEDRHEVRALLRRFPNVDEEALKKKFPRVNVEKMKYLIS